jgi:hypothetical protein
MRVSHHHLQCPVPKQLGHCAQIDPMHYESTGKGVAVAMPTLVQRKMSLSGGVDSNAR